MKFWLCIDDTDDKTKSVGTGEIASVIYGKIAEKGCVMRLQVTRHQLLLDPRIAYTSHNSSMCMEGETKLSAEELLRVARETLLEMRSPISQPGICLFMPKEGADCNEIIRFGQRAKVEVLHREEAITLAAHTENLFLEAPAGDGSGMIGALAGVGLRLAGNDGTFRGKIVLEEPLFETARDMKKRMQLSDIWDGYEDRMLADEEMVRAEGQIKLVYRNFGAIAAVRKAPDGIYEMCSKASVYEQTISGEMPKIENCVYFEWDNDIGEQWTEKAGTCENCLHRRLTKHGMKCTRGGGGTGGGKGGGRGRGDGSGGGKNRRKHEERERG